jgi:hypothetical protein
MTDEQASGGRRGARENERKEEEREESIKSQLNIHGAVWCKQTTRLVA